MINLLFLLAMALAVAPFITLAILAWRKKDYANTAINFSCVFVGVVGTVFGLVFWSAVKLGVEDMVKLVVLGSMSLVAVWFYALTVKWYLQREYADATLVFNVGLVLTVPMALLYWGVTGRDWLGILLVVLMPSSWVFFVWRRLRQ